MAGSTFSWIATSSGGDWSDPSNWADITTGQTPSGTAPGQFDIVTIDNTGTGAVTGSGSALALTFLGQDQVLGGLNAGTLVVDGGLNLGSYSQEIPDDVPGATITADTVLAGSITVDGTGAALFAGSIEAANLSAIDGGSIETDGLALTDGTLSVVNSGIVARVPFVQVGDIEVGNSGSATPGAVTVDQGYTVTADNATVSGNIVDNGLISGTAIQIGQILPVLYATEVRGPRGETAIDTFYQAVPYGDVTGAGTIEVDTGGTINLLEPVAGSQTLRLDGSAELNLYGSVDAGSVILMDGGSDTLAIGNTFNGVNIFGIYFDTGLQTIVPSNYFDSVGEGAFPPVGPNLSLPVVSATIAGFDASDEIVLQGTSFVGGFYENGVLNLVSANGPQISYTLAIAGDYGNDSFVVADGTIRLDVGSVVGTSGPDTYVWIGGTEGAWGSASNWADLTADQAPAQVAPGGSDNVSFDNAIVIGNGNAASATFYGDDTIVGVINAGALTVSGSAATLTISQSAVSVTGITALGSSNAAGTLTAAGSSTIDTSRLELSDNDGNLVNVDTTSVIEVGNLGSAKAGAITIDPGDTLAGAGTLVGNVIDNGMIVGPSLVLAGNVVDNGVIAGTSLILGGPQIDGYNFDAPGAPPIYVFGSLSGTGTVAVEAMGTATIAAAVTTAGLTFELEGTAELDVVSNAISAGNTIDLIGNLNTLILNDQYNQDYQYYQEPGFSGPLPALGAAIEGFNSTDTIIVVGPTIDNWNWAGSTLDVFSGGTVVAGFNLGTSLENDSVTANLAGYDGLDAVTEITISPLCFCAGTRIATPRGDVPVEALSVGDVVLTMGGDTRPIVWLGSGRVLATRGRRNAATPVIVRKGALADNVPHQDLRVTKAHSLYLDGVLIPVEFLVNHRSILWDDQAQELSIYHIELETHDVLVANGAPAESYRDDGNRWLFRNGNTGWDQPAKPPCAPVLTGGTEVDAVWRRLLDRAGPRPGLPTTDDPDLHLLTDGKRVDATTWTDGVYVFDLRRAPDEMRLISHAAVPQELGLARDPRCLGVAVRRIVVRQGTRFRTFRANDALLADGFHAFEPDKGFRWTDGNARLPSKILAGFIGPIEVVVHLDGTTQYVGGVAAVRAA